MPGSAILTIGDKEYDAAKSSNNAPNAIAQSKQKSLEEQETHKKEEELLKLLINLYDKLSHKMQKGPCLEAEEQISKFEGILTRLKKNQEREQKKLSSSRKKHKHYSHEVHQTRLAWLAERKDLLTQASFKHTLIVKRLGNLRSSVGAKAAVSQTIQSCETVNLLTDRDASVGPEASETQPIQMEPDRGSTILAQKAETRKEGTVSGVDFDLPSDTLKSIVPSPQNVKKAQYYKRSSASDEDIMQLSQSPDPHSSCAGKNIVFSDGSRELVVGGGEIAERRDNDRKRKLNPRDGTNENSSKYVGLTCDLFESQGKQHCLLTPYPKDVQNSAGNIDTLSSGLTNKDAVLPTVPTKFCSSNQEDINLEMSRDCPQQIDEVDTYFELFTGVTIRGSAMENHIMTGQSAVCKDNSVKVTAKCSANPASYQFHQVQKNTQSQAENSNKVSVSGSVINLLDNEAHGESPAYMLSEREDSSYPANAIERNACDVRPMIGTKVDFMKPLKKTNISHTECDSCCNITTADIFESKVNIDPARDSTTLMLQESLHKFPNIPENEKCTRPKTNTQVKPQADLHDISPLADTGDSTSVIVKEPELSKDAQKTGLDKNASNQNVSVSSNYNKGSFTSASGLQEHDFPSTAMLHKIKDASSTRDVCLENSSMIQTEEKQKSAILDCTSQQIWVEFKSVHMIHDSELSSGSLEFVDFWSERFSDIRMTEAFWDSVDTW
ncbi:hypothetical protein EGW08_006376 [Elysia chlorotica]|uniref:Uncharacterized protein n=1 Tax=Elysia chlorotica TaxID=188477 RepID=A0A433TWI3_ELYCH|nr:hypothetical protein EGW08_006376 [Elysia chlorotica]